VSIRPAIPYLESLFDEGDHIFFQLIHSTRKHKGPDGKDVADTRLLPLMSLSEATDPNMIERLLGFQADGWTVYVCMNPFPRGTESRKERFVEEIRNVYIESDKDKGGAGILERIQQAVSAGLIPSPHSILQSSPGNYHIVWNVDGFTPGEAKAENRALASYLGGDMASTDLHRVLRMPGFVNFKYSDQPVSVLIEHDPDVDCCTKDAFKLPTTVVKAGGAPIQSEDLEIIVNYVEKNASEAKFELGDRAENGGGYNWIVTCPWASAHTHGGSTALVMVLEDERLEFNCFHGHCNGSDGPHRGWSDIRRLWETVVGHHQKFGESPAENLVVFGSSATNSAAAAPEYKLDIKVNGNYRRMTDLGNAERLIDACGDDVKFCNDTGQWYIWTGVKWEVAGKIGPQAHMQAVVRLIKEEAELVKPENDSPEALEQANKLKASLNAWARKSESSPAINGAITQARAFHKVQVRVSDFNTDLHQINLSNGVLNLRTFGFRSHEKSDLMTKVANVSYDPAATCPMFQAFLDKSVPNKETQRFLQQAAGYTLTGDVSEDCLFLNIGAGRNGKGVFLNLMKRILGDYALQASFDSFTARKGGGGLEIRSDIARLEGGRMVIASENEEDQRVAESLLKTLTGSDTVTARKHYEGEREYSPQFKLWFGINHEPRITGVDDGIWSRIHRIPWNVFIRPEERIPNLRTKIIDNESSGVLNWMIAGLKDYRINRLVPGEEVLRATQEYREESDQIKLFLNERCDLHTSGPITHSEFKVGASSPHMKMHKLGPRK
jgi:P4 family phage/plasmid primase-like protien